MSWNRNTNSRHSVSARVDELCDRFEAELRSGQASDLDVYLSELDSADDREHLLAELLLLEFDYRGRTGETVNLDNLCARLPDDEPLIREVARAHFGQATPADPATHAETIASQYAATLAVASWPSPAGYVLLDRLGQGGMGVVFKARQLSADRVVAIKLIRPDFIDALDAVGKVRMIDRFRAEVKAVAKLEHENIIRVYDVGQVGGLPYFSMQFVEGQSLSSARWSPCENRAAAAFIEPIARALGVAHSHGVLHRDVKPHNILVESATRKPMLVDFGIAKLVEANLQMTSTGDFVGSPPYAAPEQLLDATRVDERADVYSLGATLYYLLTGRPPFQANSVAVILRQIRSNDPLPPRRLNPSIDVDLETICLKCLEKEPRRRYATAIEVGDELSRYLHHQPILARPVGRIGRLRRWSRRNPAIATLTATALLLMLTIAVVSSFSYYQVSQALQQQEQQRRRAEAERSIAEQREREAEENLQLARQVVETFLVQVSNDPRLKAYGVETLRHELLDLSRKFYDVIAHKRGPETEIQLERAAAYRQLATLTAKLGTPEAAIGFFDQSLAVLDEVDSVDNELVRMRRAECLNQLGLLRLEMGHRPQARESLEEAFTIFSDLAENSKTDSAIAAGLASSHHKLGLFFIDEPDPTRAEQHSLDAIRIFEELLRTENSLAFRIELAKSHNNLAIIYRGQGDAAGAEAHYQAALELWENAHDEVPSDPDCRTNLAHAHNNLGVLYRNIGDLDRAASAFATALEIRRVLVENHPDVPEYESELAATQNNLGTLYRDLGQPEPARRSYTEAVQIYARLAAKSHGIASHAPHLASARNNLGTLLIDLGEYQTAEQVLIEAADQFRRLVEQDHAFPQHAVNLAGVLSNLGRLYEELDAVDKLEKLLIEQCDIQAAIVDRFPDQANHTVQLVRILARLTDFHSTRNSVEKTAKAFERLEQAVQRLETSADVDPRLLVEFTVLVGDYCLGLERPGDAMLWYDKAHEQVMSQQLDPPPKELLEEILARRQAAQKAVEKF